MSTIPHVAYFQRKPIPGISFSLEQIFEQLREDLAGRITFDIVIAQQYSRGILPRLSIALDAFRKQGMINHVTGDIHFAAIGLKRASTILTILDSVAVDGRTGFKKFLLNLFWYQIPIRRVASVTTISDFSRSAIERITRSRTPISVIPVAISSSFVRKENLKMSLSPTVLLVGTRENKNILRIAKALTGLPVKILVIGMLSSEQLFSLRDTGCKIENIVNASRIELVEAYQRADLLCFCSTFEGFGMPILEANVTGIPVVTSNNTSMPEVAGDAALLVDPFSVNSIREGVMNILKSEDLRKTLIMAGFRNAKRFSRDEVAGKYMELYVKLAEYSRCQMV